MLDKIRPTGIFSVMILPLISRGSMLLMLVLLAFGLVTSAQARPANSVVLLNDAYATLANAKHDYKGHRVEAMKQIELALGEIGEKISGHGHAHEPQAASDAQLRAAQRLLEQARAGLSAKAYKHVEGAIKQISIALSIR